MKLIDPKDENVTAFGRLTPPGQGHNEETCPFCILHREEEAKKHQHEADCYDC